MNDPHTMYTGPPNRPSGERAGARSFVNHAGVRKPKDIAGAAKTICRQ